MYVCGLTWLVILVYMCIWGGRSEVDTLHLLVTLLFNEARSLAES